MQELTQAIPDVDVLLALEPEELGAKLLFLLRAAKEGRASIPEYRVFRQKSVDTTRFICIDQCHQQAGHTEAQEQLHSVYDCVQRNAGTHRRGTLSVVREIIPPEVHRLALCH